MKNYLSRTFWMTLCAVCLLGAAYYLPTLTFNGHTLRRVNLLSDIQIEVPDTLLSDTLLLPPIVKLQFVDTCKTGLTCIEDYADSTQRGMAHFYQALSEINTRQEPVRIAYFGDSFVEADILTADLRSKLQEHYGGCGVGYVDITSATNGFRPTVRHSFHGWSSHAITDSTGFDRKRQGISCHYFIPDDKAMVEVKGQAKYGNHLDAWEQSTIYFEANDTVLLKTIRNRKDTVDHYFGGELGMQALTIVESAESMRWTVDLAPDSTTFYGVALEGKQGISLDNFGLRSSSGLSLRSIPLSKLKQFNRVRPYDLIILHYGLNVATPKGVNYDHYQKGLIASINHLKVAFPQASILIVGVSDRAYKTDNGEMRTMPGIRNLIHYQQHTAALAGVAFWNLYEAMGGEGSIGRMVEAKPAQANLDYTHINFRGGAHLAGLLYETLVYEQERYERRREYEAE